MKDFDVKKYIDNKEQEYRELVNLIDQMEDTGKNYVEHRGVAYNKVNILGKMSRIENQIQGVTRYVSKMKEENWRESHQILLEKLADQEHDYHLELDGGHNLSSATRYINDVLEKEGDNLSNEAVAALKNAANKTTQTATYLGDRARERWVRDRFFELASQVEFDEQNGDLFPVNIQEMEDFSPLDVVNNGHVKLEKLKEANHHRNVFLDRVTKIKEEALKEALFREEMEKPEVAKDF